MELEGGEKLTPEEANSRYPGMSVPFREPVTPLVAQIISDQEEKKRELSQKIQSGPSGAYSSWVTGYDQSFLSLWRRNLGSQSVAKYGGIDDLFKCRPSLLYPIFINQWSGTVNDDKLLIGSVNTCVAVRPFSMYGLPYSK